ncbi:FtsB family cell division protein [Bifidobacterium saguinibicoloris]|uniref:FtsB family cell division protein n=1 Tax=Bifidobacterium saguinibicoloris TaxID=2834433 RepID=UPI001C57A297|nr:septum formation initiator family protein [Bifidobacterium saguinibicoloris]MBW3080381.1 septum formation initiator family protein [Bifidobacterium saguinibicoloris]
MSTRNRGTRTEDRSSSTKRRRRSGTSGPIAFFISLFIVAVGLIQLVSTFNTYATDLAHLNSLKREEAALVAKKQDLENDISRWDDKNYVAAQARERLGFVFPGEQSVHVLNPQAVTGDADGAETQDAQDSQNDDTSNQLPWYSELSYAFKKADQPVKTGAGGTTTKKGTTQQDGTAGSASESDGTDKEGQQ